MQLTCFGCFITPNDPWHAYAVIRKLSTGLCQFFNAGSKCPIFPKVTCDGRTVILCTKRLNEGGEL